MKMDEQRFAIVLGFGKVRHLYFSWDETSFVPESRVRTQITHTTFALRAVVAYPSRTHK